MYKNNIKAFTFVELIVVITILAILSTIGFGVYQSYLAGGRDTNRLVQLSDIRDGLERYSINSRLPFPENMIEIQANGNTFAYQGYAGDGVIKTIGYDGGGQDIEYGNYLTYMLGENQRDFQLMTYIDDAGLLSDSITSTTYANQDYSSMFPKVLGSPLGVIVDDLTNAPLQTIDSIVTAKSYDIILNTEEVIAYFTDKNRLVTGQGDDLSLILPDKSCSRIQKLGKSSGSKTYIINPTGTSKVEVYCDMDVEGGGWTFIGHIDGTTPTEGISFSGGLGNYTSTMADTGTGYFLDTVSLAHTEMMALINTNDPIVANDNNALVLLKYGLDAEMFHTDDLNGCISPLGQSEGLYYKLYIDGVYNWSNKGSCNSSGWSLRPDPVNPTGAYIFRSRNSTSSAPYGTEYRPSTWTLDTGDTNQGRGHDMWLFVR